MIYPNETLTETQWSLSTFNEEATAALHGDGDIIKFTRMVLAGRIFVEQNNGNMEQRRILLNARQGLPELNGARVIRDFDSVIGISQTLPFNRPFDVWPVAPFKHTLTANNHLKGLAYDAQVCSLKIFLFVLLSFIYFTLLL
jgi:hypothetical protein